MYVCMCDMRRGVVDRAYDLMNIIPHAIVPAPPISPYYPTSNTTTTTTTTTAAAVASAAAIPTSTHTTNITSSNTTLEVKSQAS